MTLTTSQRRVDTGPVVAYLLVLLLVAVNVAAPSDAPLPWWLPIASALLYAAAQLNPALRVGAPHLTPRNAAMVIAGVQLALFPTLVQFGGAYQGRLPYIPDGDALTAAVVCQMLAFLGLTLGLSAGHRETVAERAGATPREAVYLLVGLGAVGLLIRYPSPGALLDYFAGGGSAGEIADGSLLGALSSFLLPCLGFGVAVSALNALKRNEGRITPYIMAAGLVAALSTSLFSYNRAATLVPMVVFAAVYAAHIRPVGRARAIAAALILVIAASALTSVRSDAAREQIRAVGGQASQFKGYGLGLNELQLYFAAPQFVAFADNATPPPGESIVLNALVSPVPVLGKGPREHNGTRTYNAAIYGHDGAVDQTLPTLVELRWDLGPLGILAGFVLVGLGVGYATRRFLRAMTLGEAFAWMFAGCWLAASLIMQIETLAQVAIYWSIPLLVLTRSRRPATD